MPDSEPNDTDEELPAAVRREAETLTRRAEEAVDENERAAYLDERATLLADHGYTARLREDDTGETLVFYPEEWVDDGVVYPDRIEDTERAIERSFSGTGSGDNWEEIEAHNRRVVDRVREEYGEIHGANADAFATFMGNHYAKRIESATPDEREEFRTEYFRRNAWPTDAQREAIDRSLELVMETADSL